MSGIYSPAIGLEIHVELATKTKIFCGCKNEFGAKPNTNVCPVCLGMPGALPMPNRRVMELASMVGTVLNCEINRDFRFDRKNYLYPDNPQNYQISQLYSPIGVNGYVTVQTGSGEKKIRIHEMHMEEDAGKLIHSESGETLIDYNRAGVPLVEIVTEPDMADADEVIAFLEKLHTMIRYTGASDCRMNEGSMRVDVNLSVSDTDSLGTRTEMKNLNSFKAIARAIESEKKRQTDVLTNGGMVDQETRRWDDEKGVSTVMRSKEDAMDYRYFPDPDLPVLHISDEELSRIIKEIPELPDEKAKRYKKEFNLPEYDIDIITSEPAYASIFEKTVELNTDPKAASNWIMGEMMYLMKDRGMDPDELTLSPKSLHDLIELIKEGVINQPTAKQVFEVIFEKDTDVRAYVDEHGLAMVSDEGEIEAVVKEVIKANPQSVSDYHAGKKKAIGYLIGQVMAATGGKGNPNLVRELIEKNL